ncbi:MAG: M23 family metallopeptidase [Alphaproteobacteria bacterium]|nr:M23 family metallopeptidase [Alphaproteobacteria bacterium]
MTKSIALAALLLATLAETASAGLMELRGTTAQGGLLRGTVAPDCRVTLDGLEVPVAENGGFLIGFGYDQKPWALVKAFCPGAQARQSLQIRQRAYDEQHIDGLPEDMVTYDEATLARIRVEAEAVAAARAVETELLAHQAPFVWPVIGQITGVYGSRRVLNGVPKQPHYGVDVAAPVGTPVAAAAAGEVTFASDLYLSGKTIIIDHGFGLSTSYLHLSETAVGVGDTVTQGETIGAVGTSGRTTGAHFDWRVNLLDRRLDPVLVAGPMPEE